MVDGQEEKHGLLNQGREGDPEDGVDTCETGHDEVDGVHKSCCGSMMLRNWKDVARGNVDMHGEGIVLYFENLYGLIWLLAVSLVPWMLLVVVRFAKIGAQGGPKCNGRGSLMCALQSYSVEDSHVWWLAHTSAAIFTGLCVAAGILMMALRQHRIWSTIAETYPSVSSRSVLVTSRSLHGVLPLVPSGEEVSEYFKQHFGAVTNVLVILDIGKLLRLRRVQSELQMLYEKAERSDQKWRGPQLGLGRFLPCRICRRCAKRASERRMDRFRRYVQNLDDLLDREETEREVEAVGCVLVTFKDREAAQAVLSTAMEHGVRENFGQIDGEDHASSWWFAPGYRLPVQVAVSGGEHMYVRRPPAPNDIDFESFVPQNTQSRTMKLAQSLVVYASALTVFSSMAGGLVFAFRLKPWYFTSMLGLSVVAGIVAAFSRIVFLLATRRNRVQMLATFTLQERSVFCFGLFFSMCCLVPCAMFTLLSVNANKDGNLELFSLLTLSAFQSWPLFFPRTPNGRFELGRKHADHTLAFFMALLLAPRMPYILFTTMLLLVLRYLREKRAIVQETRLIRPRFGAAVAVGSVHMLGWAVFIHIVAATLQCAHACYQRPSCQLQHHTPSLSTGAMASIISFTIAGFWHFCSTWEYFRSPSVEFNANEIIRRHLGKNGLFHESSSISFSPTSSGWEAALSNKQHTLGENEEYRLPIDIESKPYDRLPAIL